MQSAIQDYASGQGVKAKNPLAVQLAGLQISEKNLEPLQKNNIETVFDLLLRVPKSVVEQQDNPGLLYLEAGRNYVVSGQVLACKHSGFGSKRRLEAVIQDETGRMNVIFFGPAVRFAEKLLKPDASVTLAGEAKEFLGRIQMVHPKFVTNSEAQEQKALSTYSQISGLSSPIFKRMVAKGLALVKKYALADHVPQALRDKLRMNNLPQALIAIHEPQEGHEHEWDERKSSPNFRRLAFEELLAFYVRLFHERRLEKKQVGHAMGPGDILDLCKDFLPFSLTKAQERVVQEIITDVSVPKAMARLVQGDVGSGKTAVSALVTRHVVQNHLQAAVMAPTEILAEQLYKAYKNFFSKTDKIIALLTASIKNKERAAILAGLEQQTIDVVIGTHALLSEGIVFKRLGLLVIDEQHRFGVHQRAELINAAFERQHFSPHLLVMSATPIPRSLALTMYGDLDLSVIDERPAGRQPIHTQILGGPVLDSMRRLCERILATGQKAFIVFPLIEESESLDLEHAQKATAILQEQFGAQSVMLLHGKMKAQEKAHALMQFRDNKISFLVATTVVEVGIDVPDATCMVIVHPERFGLAQLHQLRGRVGRGRDKSYCFLVSDIKNRFGTAFKRLDALCKTDDGFKLAEIDLEIRGPGELLGTRQSGLPNFLVFNHLDFSDLLEPAKAHALALVSQEFKHEFAHLYKIRRAHIS